MYRNVPPPQNMLRGDQFRNPRFTKWEVRPSDEAIIATGEMRADSVEGQAAKPTLPNIPFRYIIPADASVADYICINNETFRRLRTGETLLDLDFAPTPPPQAEASTFSHGGMLLLSAVALGVAVAFSSRN